MNTLWRMERPQKWMKVCQGWKLCLNTSEWNCFLFKLLKNSGGKVEASIWMGGVFDIPIWESTLHKWAAVIRLLWVPHSFRCASSYELGLDLPMRTYQKVAKKRQQWVCSSDNLTQDGCAINVCRVKKPEGGTSFLNCAHISAMGRFIQICLR